MRTILAICLLTAAFGIMPSADASVTCDPVTGQLCAGSYAYGTCDNGYAQNFASFYQYSGSEYTSASAYTYCANYGWGPESATGAGYNHCNFSTWECESVGVQWYSYSGYCDTYVYAYAEGQYVYQPLGCPAGGPPNVPALFP